MTKDEIISMVKGWAANVKVPPEVYESRMQVCNSCDKLSTVLGVERCTECGCVLLIKANGLRAKCPLSKW